MFHNLNLIDIPFEEYQLTDNFTSYTERIVKVFPYLKKELFFEPHQTDENYLIYLIHEDNSSVLFLIVNKHIGAIPQIAVLTDNGDYEMSETEVIDYLTDYRKHSTKCKLTDLVISDGDEVINEVRECVENYLLELSFEKDANKEITESMITDITAVILDTIYNYTYRSQHSESHFTSQIQSDFVDFFDDSEDDKTYSGNNTTSDYQQFFTDRRDKLPYRLQYALSSALGVKGLNDIISMSYNVENDLQRKAEADAKIEHQYDPVPRNRPIESLLKDFLSKGKKSQARTLLRKRIPYASFTEQKKVLTAFLHDTQTDREFALRFLDKNWDPYYYSEVEIIWHTYHDKDCARIVVHHFPMEFIEAKQDMLIKKFNYLQVRLRLPANAPIDRSRLLSHTYLYLCARLKIDIADNEAERILYQNIISILTLYIPFQTEIKKPDALLADSIVNSIVWSLGSLGKTNIILRFASFYKIIAPLLTKQDYTAIRTKLANIHHPLDFTEYDRILYLYTNTSESNTSITSKCKPCIL